MSFEVEHEKWMKLHVSKRNGERRDALLRGHGYGNRLFVEKIWWTLAGNFDGLHPEYEVADWRGRSFFVDLMWISGGERFAFEIMDFGSHGKDRTKYRMDLNRGLFLQSQQCCLISISLDEIKENPSFVQSILRNMLTSHLVKDVKRLDYGGHYAKIEKKLIQYAIRNNRVIQPAKAARELELHKQTVIRYCGVLASKGKLLPVPSGESGKIYQYKYTGSFLNIEG